MIMPKKSGIIMHFFALFRIYFRINHYIATAKTQLNITAMKKFLIYFCYAAILCSICSCSKDDIQSGVEIDYYPHKFTDMDMRIYTMHSHGESGILPIVYQNISAVAPMSFDLIPGNYYVEFGFYKAGFSITEGKRTYIWFGEDGGKVFYD